MDTVIRTLLGLDAAETTALANNGVISWEDLSMVTFDDITDIIPVGMSIMKRRRLFLISQYLALGQTVNVASTMPDINSYLNTPAVPVFNQAAPLLPLPPLPPDPMREAMRLYVNSIEKFGLPDQL
jgi:hypothetical protein